MGRNTRWVLGGVVVLISLSMGFACSSSYARERKPRKKRVKYVKPKGWLGHLLKLNKSRGDMAEELKIETEHYGNIKKAIDHEDLKVGESSEKIKKRYGAPTIELLEDSQTCKRWVYKPGDESYFTGEKIYLFFDADNNLSSWQFVEAEPEEEKESQEKQEDKD